MYVSRFKVFTKIEKFYSFIITRLISMYNLSTFTYWLKIILFFFRLLWFLCKIAFYSICEFDEKVLLQIKSIFYM